jgi:hypothetical protein
MSNQITDYLQRITPSINFTKSSFYTPTFFGLGTGVVNPNSIQASSRRVDEFLEIKFSFNLQTAGSGSSQIAFSLPTGMTIDINKIRQSTSALGLYVGTCMFNSLTLNTCGLFINPSFLDRVYAVKNGFASIVGSEWTAGGWEGYASVAIVGWN